MSFFQGLVPAHRRPLAWLMVLCLFFALANTRAGAQGTAIPADIEFTPIDAAPPGIAIDTSGLFFSEGTPAANSSQPSSAAPATAKPLAVLPVSLWVTLLTGLLGGFAAVLMPCIFPLLPMTVSFFTKRASSRQAGIRQALLYSGSIVVIYVALGLLITVVFGADALNNLATNGLFNLFFFGLLVVFAASFLGAFELTLPSAWVNKTDTQADKGGVLGIFFMAATLALVSFSCTGPIIGTLLVQAATSKQLLGPVVGMLGFSVALALPFTLLSLFPGWLSSLPKSGGWLNSVKVVLGFVELALALKFLSNVDLAYHWEWFDREVFLALWIIIFALLGFYLLGKIKFSHDSDTSHITLPRLFLAIVTLAFTVYLVPGLWGAPLQAVAAFLPPQTTQDFDLYTPTLTGRGTSAGPTTPRSAHKYASLFQAPLGLDAYFDYAEARAAVQAAGKPLLIDFTGHACLNCRKMEATVWPRPAVLPLIRDRYVLVQLYVDDKTDLPAAEQTVSTFSGKRLTTLAAKWSDLQASRYHANSQPYYVLLDPKTEKILTEPQGAEYDATQYAAFLQSGLAAYRAGQP